MMSPERALEHMSVEKAWTLLDSLSSQVVGKQSELQVHMYMGCGDNYRALAELCSTTFRVFRICFAAYLLQSFTFFVNCSPQLMVGSRYHELIESADSIVSMKETSMEVLGLLRNFPHACSNVIQQVRRGRAR